jgi:hypothetical protein
MQEELDYYELKNLQVPLEERCQGEKEEWYFRDSSWYMRGVDGYDRYGCNAGAWYLSVADTIPKKEG